MQVLFHALGATMGGAQRHLASFLPALSSTGRHETYHVLVRESLELKAFENIRVHRVPDKYAAVGPSRIWFDTVEVPRIIRTWGVNALVSLMNIGPIRVDVPHIVFQRNALLFSPEHTRLFPLRQIAKFRLQRYLAVAAMKRAQQIVTPSHSMASLVQKDCPDLPHDRFFVLPHAIDSNAYMGELDPVTAMLLRRSGAKLLYPSLAGPHKGFSLLLQIAGSFPKSFDATIYVTGGDEGGSLINDVKRGAKKAGVEQRIVFLGRIRQDQMGALYRACDLLLYVSPIESFGFSLLEAMAFQLPVIAIDTSTNRELCGGAAKYFPVYRPASAADIIEEALGETSYKGLKHATQCQFKSRDWSWDWYVTTLLTVIGKQVNDSSPKSAHLPETSVRPVEARETGS